MILSILLLASIIVNPPVFSDSVENMTQPHYFTVKNEFSYGIWVEIVPQSASISVNPRQIYLPQNASATISFFFYTREAQESKILVRAAYAGVLLETREVLVKSGGSSAQEKPQGNFFFRDFLFYGSIFTVFAVAFWRIKRYFDAPMPKLPKLKPHKVQTIRANTFKGGKHRLMGY